jgi:hypothetical protein
MSSVAAAATKTHEKHIFIQDCFTILHYAIYSAEEILLSKARINKLISLNPKAGLTITAVILLFPDSLFINIISR